MIYVNLVHNYQLAPNLSLTKLQSKVDHSYNLFSTTIYHWLARVSVSRLKYTRLSVSSMSRVKFCTMVSLKSINRVSLGLGLDWSHIQRLLRQAGLLNLRIWDMSYNVNSQKWDYHRCLGQFGWLVWFGRVSHFILFPPT